MYLRNGIARMRRWEEGGSREQEEDRHSGPGKPARNKYLHANILNPQGNVNGPCQESHTSQKKFDRKVSESVWFPPNCNP